MFSPSSGSLNSPADDAGAGLGEGATERAGVDPGPGGAELVCWGAGAAALGTFCTAAGLAAAAGDFPSAPSTVKITWPTLILSPSFTRISCTVPLTEDGTSTTALSVSNSITDWPAFTVVPGDTINRTRSPCSMFSPNSGSLNSITGLSF